MKVVILTGAGISAESGLNTFRGNGGLWENEPIEAVATPEGFRSDPVRVKEFYSRLRTSLPRYKPNAAHEALVKLEEKLGDDFLLVTQNVDDLHERAGSKRILHMHGELKKLRCAANERHVFPFDGEETLETKCPVCGAPTRPHIVWFGEVPLYMEKIERALRHTEEFVYIGTSSVVYPAAGFKQVAKRFGAHVTCLNLEIDPSDPNTDTCIEGVATEIVPRWCENYLKGLK